MRRGLWLQPQRRIPETGSFGFQLLTIVSAARSAPAWPESVADLRQEGEHAVLERSRRSAYDPDRRLEGESLMKEQMTCGKGLAENSVLPEKLGDLAAAMAKIFEIHMTALDPLDENGKKECDAYMKLVMELREIAVRLESTAEHMAGSRDLPTARHDEAAMRDPKALHAFERFVEIKQELLRLLQSGFEQDRDMLALMRRAQDTASSKASP
jgi:hypothetical protein